MKRERDLTIERGSTLRNVNTSRSAMLTLAGSAAFSLPGPIDQARYECEGSDEDQGIRVQGRSAGRADSDQSVGRPNGGRGDEHHNIYGGLNY